MEIHQLRYFCAVARNGTFELLRNNYPVMVRALAAQVERVAQPSLSQQILKLEAELGAKLFDRLSRAARLTSFGAAFLPKAGRILRELSEAKTVDIRFCCRVFEGPSGSRAAASGSVRSMVIVHGSPVVMNVQFAVVS